MEHVETTEYLRIVKDGTIYDWVDNDNCNTQCPMVGYLNKRGIKEFEERGLAHSPIRFKQFIESEMKSGILFRKDLYKLTWSFGMLDREKAKVEWYHSLKDLKERYNFLFLRSYFVTVHDVQDKLLHNVYETLKQID